MRVELYFFLNKKSSKFYLQNTRLYVQFYLKSVEVALFSSRSRIYAAKSEKAGNKLGNKVMVVVKVQTSTREKVPTDDGTYYYMYEGICKPLPIICARAYDTWVK